MTGPERIALGVGALALMAVAFVVGWAAPGRPPAPSLALTHPRPQPAIYLRRAGGDLLFALDGLRGELGADQPVGGGDPEARRPVVYRPPPPPAPPPPPDVALVFRRAVTAVVSTPGQGLAVLLAQPGQRSRLLRPGEAFDDRWRLTALTSSEAVLGDGVSERHVALFGGPASAAGWGAPSWSSTRATVVAPRNPDPDGVM